MKTHLSVRHTLRLLAFVSAYWVASLALFADASPSPEKVAILFDSDIGPDCDDAGTLAVLHALADQGEAVVLGMACCTSSEWGSPCLAAINTYYGRPDVPVGTLKARTGFLCGSGDQKYNERVAKDFPNQLKSGTNAPDAVALYRKILAGQPDHSVTVVATGPLPNLAALLASTPDHSSPLSGLALVSRKVTKLVVMGGLYPSGGEWNFGQDAAAAKKVTEEWPTPIVFSGGEVGEPIGTGARLVETPPGNPVRKAYELYNGPGKNRSSWDQTAMYYAIRGGGGLFKLSADGTNSVAADGSNHWKDLPGGRHRYLIKAVSDAEIAKVLEGLMIESPRRK